MSEVFILSGARTPFATWARGRDGSGAKGGRFAGTDVFTLGAAALDGALAKAALEARDVKHVVLGNMYYSGAEGCYGSRYVALKAGVPVSAATPTVSMACGSGLYSVITGAREVREGHSLVAVGGMDNISRLPKDDFIQSFHDPGAGCNIGMTVQKLAAERGIEREAMDVWALRSHKLAGAALKEGHPAREIVPVAGVEADDAVLAEPHPDHFMKSRQTFGGAVTKANTHAMVDGASVLLLSDENLTPRATGANGGSGPLGKLVSYATVGVDPHQMGLASVPAIRLALQRAGLELSDIDLFEINETFAAQMLLDIKELGLPQERVNVNGGSIALGHPFAGTGAKLVLGLLWELKRRNLRYGVASICVGGGQGVALVVER